MTVYYEDDYVTLYHGDCLELTDWLEADVLVTDPPYGIAWSVPEGAFNKELGKRKRGVGHAGIRNDEGTEARDNALKLWGEDKPAIVFGQLNSAPPEKSKQTLVWQKPDNSGIFGAIGGWRRNAEAIYLLGEWPQIPADKSAVIKSGTKALATYVKYGHPHGKPNDVMEMLINSTPSGVIADPFAGGGSTLVAARNLGRRAIGVELEEKYCEIIANRLSQSAFNFEELV